MQQKKRDHPSSHKHATGRSVASIAALNTGNGVAASDLLRREDGEVARLEEVVTFDLLCHGAG